MTSISETSTTEKLGLEKLISKIISDNYIAKNKSIFEQIGPLPKPRESSDLHGATFRTGLDYEKIFNPSRSIGTSDIRRIASLARIGLDDEEVPYFAAQIRSILTFVEQLQKVDVSDTPPTDQVTGLEDVWREDIVRPSLPRAQLLANAPAQKNGYIVVKRVLNG